MGRKSKDWQEEDEKKKKKGKRKSLFRSLFSSNLRSRSVGQLLDPTAAPPPDAQQPQQQPLAEQPRESTSSPPATPCRPSTPPSTPPSAARVPDDLAADEPGGGATGPRALMVQVIQARRLRAADSNGLSDPYCVVKVRWCGGGAGLGRLLHAAAAVPQPARPSCCRAGGRAQVGHPYRAEDAGASLERNHGVQRRRLRGRRGRRAPSLLPAAAAGAACSCPAAAPWPRPHPQPPPHLTSLCSAGPRTRLQVGGRTWGCASSTGTWCQQTTFWARQSWPLLTSTPQSAPKLRPSGCPCMAGRAARRGSSASRQERYRWRPGGRPAAAAPASKVRAQDWVRVAAAAARS